MYRFYLLMTLLVFVLSGCGSSVSENENVNALPDNTDAGNANANQEVAAEDEEVPKFYASERALKKGIEYLDANKIENAIDALKQAVELDEDLADAHFQLGVALSLKESEEERKVPEEDEDEDEKKSSKSKKVEKKPSEIAFKKAIKAYKKMIRKDSKDHEAYYNLGRAYNKVFDDKEARKALERAVKLNKDDTLYRTELGAVLIKLAQYPPAVRQLNKAIEIDEENYRAEDLLARAKAGKRRVDHVQKQKPRATSKGPSSSAPKSNTSKSNTSEPSRPRTVPKPKAPPKKVDIKPAPPKKNSGR